MSLGSWYVFHRQNGDVMGENDADFTDLNRQFYSAAPYDYFRRRLQMLMLQAGKPQSIRRILRGGFAVGKIIEDGQSAQPLRTAGDRRREVALRQQFVVAESVTLLHHASETLLRLYVAHRGCPPCPWVVLSDQRNPAAFKKLAQEIARSQASAERDSIAVVFLGFRNSPSPSVPDSEWQASIDNIQSWMRYYARWFVDGAHLYNATKHGLAVQAGSASLRIAETGADTAAISHEGPALSFLERDEDGDFSESTQWVSLDEVLFGTAFASALVANLWAIAKLRYLDEPIAPGTTGLLDKPVFADAMKELRGDTLVSKMSMHKVAVVLSRGEPSSKGGRKGD